MLKMASSRLELVSKKLVKPSSFTQPSLRHYKLSLLDQLMENYYIPIAFFYPKRRYEKNNGEVGGGILEESLSKTLASYYPFAGRLKDNMSLDCNDMGAMFLEARIRCKMSEILGESKMDALDIAFPKGVPWSKGDSSNPPLVAQLSHFDCGGKAISLCMSHKIGDGLTMCNFASHWAHWSRGDSSSPSLEQSCISSFTALPLTSPEFIGASIIPSTDYPTFKPVVSMPGSQDKCITKRFVFSPEKLNQLKAKAGAESEVESPTRVEVVSALIQKCAMVASKVISGSFKPSLMCTIVNIRPLLGPQASHNIAGNLFSFIAMMVTDEGEANLSRLVSDLRREKAHCNEICSAMKPSEVPSTTIEMAQYWKSMVDNGHEMDYYIFSSLNRFPTGSVDFGWGKPTRVSTAAHKMKNYFILVDNNNIGGIDAFITMEDEVMSVLEKDPEFLAFASLGSSNN